MAVSQNRIWDPSFTTFDIIIKFDAIEYKLYILIMIMRKVDVYDGNMRFLLYQVSHM